MWIVVHRTKKEVGSKKHKTRNYVEQCRRETVVRVHSHWVVVREKLLIKSYSNGWIIYYCELCKRFGVALPRAVRVVVCNWETEFNLLTWSSRSEL